MEFGEGKRISSLCERKLRKGTERELRGGREKTKTKVAESELVKEIKELVKCELAMKIQVNQTEIEMGNTNMN